jgi:hypothetical protein
MLVARALKKSQPTCGERHACFGDRTLARNMRAFLAPGDFCGLVFGMLFGEFVDQIHGLKRIRRDPLQPSFGMFQRGQIPFRFAPDINVAQSRSDVA